MQPESSPASSGAPMQGEVPELYVNTTHLEISAYDFALTMSTMHSATQKRELLRVRMSPQHALILTALMMKHVATFEKVSGGPIHVIPDAIQALQLGDAITAMRSVQPAEIKGAK